MSKRKQPRARRQTPAYRKPVAQASPARKAPFAQTWGPRILIALMAISTLGFLGVQFLPQSGQSAAPVNNNISGNIPTIGSPTDVTGNPGENPLVPVPAAEASQPVSPVSQPGPTTDGIPFIGGAPAAPAGGAKAAPTSLAGLDRTSYTQGAQALAEINKLHGSEISLTGGFAAVYSWGELKVSVWSGATANSDEAAALVSQMKEAIGKGGTPFSSPQPVTSNGRSIIQVQGPGGSHYFYQSGSNVVWLTVQAQDVNVESLLKASLQTF